MFWHQFRAHHWITAVAVIAFLFAMRQAGTSSQGTQRPAMAERPLRLSPQQPSRIAESPRLIAVEERVTRDPQVRAVNEITLRPAVTGLQSSGQDRPRGSVIRQPEEEPIRTQRPTTTTSPAPTELKYFTNTDQQETVQIPSPRGGSNAIPEQAMQPSTRIQAAQEPLPPMHRLVERAPLGDEMKPVNQLARQHLQRGFSLGDRNALYAARVEFMQALQTVGQAVDAHNGMAPNDTLSCAQALNRAMIALREADDFAPENGKLAAHLDLANLISAHRTPAGKINPPVTQMAALQCYFDYARGELIAAAAGNEVAAQAYTGLGKCCVNDPKEAVRGLGSAKAMVFHQAALATDATNHLSANELGVLLGKYGQWPEAKRLFLQAARIREDSATWQNLAVAHKQLGEHDLARLAVGESQRLQTTAPDRPSVGVDNTPTVQWVDPRAFGGPPDENRPVAPLRVANRPQPSLATQQQRNQTPPAATPWWMPWR